MAPFAKRTLGPEWFTCEFPTIGEHETKSKKKWESFLTPRLLSTRLCTSKENVEILCYQPNLVSHQFGIIFKHIKGTRDVSSAKVALRQPNVEGVSSKLAQVDDETIKGEIAEIILEQIPIEDSSREPPSQKKKIRNPGTCTRKIPARP
ncbi:hypothetical protein KIW84_036268 [Lathyrus oleraceus]|uniref:Uncharacterized protein n=1 Tax=Pisum sativum TaxID=3888 RepID=A0A9D4Y456_PEA|nr:hypothetical protein KIW84_036268 [Pisum sativum]